MRVRFLVEELGRTGGVNTILSYARALDTLDGWEAEIVVTGSAAAGPPRTDTGDIRVLGMGDATLDECDIAIATWWATCSQLWEVPARRRVVFLQSIENRFYEERHFFERFGAEQVLSLPVGYLTVAGWIRDLLGALRPDATCEVVRNGVDKRVFASATRPRRDGPLRVLVEGQPSLWFKGVDDAVEAVRSMTEPAELTVVASDPAGVRIDGARVVGGLDATGMAALYAENDVLLKLSRVESLGLAPIEAFHAGAPAIVTPYTGHEEYMDHGRNGLVVGYDDAPGTSRALDRLARDRELLSRLSAGALETAAGWPSTEQAAATLTAALERFAAQPPPDAEPALAHLQRAQRRWLELSREHARALEQARQTIDAHQPLVEELKRGALVAHHKLTDARRELEQLRASRAYRAAVAARRVIRRRPG